MPGLRLHYCVYPNCTATGRGTKDFFQISQKDPMRSVWIEKFGLENNKLSRISHICKKHFKDEAVNRINPGGVLLNAGTKLSNVSTIEFPEIAFPKIEDVENNSIFGNQTIHVDPLGVTVLKSKLKVEYENSENISVEQEVDQIKSEKLDYVESENFDNITVKDELERVFDPSETDSQQDLEKINCKAITYDANECENTFKCELCNKEFLQNCELKTHLCIHDSNLDLKDEKCDICNNTFKGLDSLKLHKSTVHSEYEIHKCQKCGEDFYGTWALKEHIKSFHEHKCEICNKSFSTVQNRNVHVKTFHEDLLNCDICKKSFKGLSSLKALKMHRATAHPECKIYNCQKCDKVFHGPWELMAHIKSAHEDSSECEKTFKYGICNNTFKGHNSLKMHKETVHEGVKPKCEKYV